MHGDVQILAGELSRHRMQDLVREAEAERLARSMRRSRMADRGASRRFARAAMAAAVWPVHR